MASFTRPDEAAKTQGNGSAAYAPPEDYQAPDTTPQPPPTSPNDVGHLLKLQAEQRRAQEAADADSFVDPPKDPGPPSNPADPCEDCRAQLRRVQLMGVLSGFVIGASLCVSVYFMIRGSNGDDGI